MADPQLIAALTALTGQMTLSQQANDAAQQQLYQELQRQQQVQQQLLAQLAAPQGQPQQPMAIQAGPRSSTVAVIPVFSGQNAESLADWLSILNRTAVSEGWVDDEKKRVAVGKLTGTALQWQDLTGNAHNGWTSWLAALQVTSKPRMSLVEWCLQIERRFQLPIESGAQ